LKNNHIELKRILILGSNGLVGISLVKKLSKKYHVFTTYHAKKTSKNDIKINLLEEKTLENAFLIAKPDIVVNLCNIYKNLDYCEKNKKIVMDINGKALKIISKISNKYNSFLIGFSSDFVFDGKTGNYKEDDQVSPINYYGKTKAIGEKNIQENANDYCIIRTSMIYGENKLRDTLADMILNKVRLGEELKLINDQFMTPTHLENFTKMLTEIIEIKYKGIIHLAGPERMSRYDFAKKLVSLSNFKNASLIPVSYNEFDFSKKMPKDSSLNTQKASSLLHNTPEKVENSLKKYLKDIS
jgi:dTDP-4-dehydrorhamnose reductase